MQDFSNSLGAFYADVIATMPNVTVVSVSEFGRNVRENGSNGTDHGRGTVMFAMGNGISGGRVYSKWPGLAKAQQADGQDLQVTIDYRDILAEIVQKRLANPNLDFVFPGWTPTMRGSSRKPSLRRRKPSRWPPEPGKHRWWSGISNCWNCIAPASPSTKLRRIRRVS